MGQIQVRIEESRTQAIHPQATDAFAAQAALKHTEAEALIVKLENWLNHWDFDQIRDALSGTQDWVMRHEGIVAVHANIRACDLRPRL